MELRGTYNVYLNEAYEQGKAPEVDIYDHIVNIHKDSLMKAYQDVYNDIVTGYEMVRGKYGHRILKRESTILSLNWRGKTTAFISLQWRKNLPGLTKHMRKWQGLRKMGQIV